MSTKTSPHIFEEIVFPNSTITHAKWHYSESAQKSTENAVQAILGVVFVPLFLLSLRPAVELLGEVWGVIVPVVVALALLFSYPAIGKRVIAHKEKKRDEYRRTHASTILKSLTEQGWKLATSKDGIETLVSDNNPYLINADGVRYYTKFLDVESDRIRFLLSLSDPKVQDEMKAQEKEKRIDYLTRLHEISKGAMNAEQKEAFQAALKLSL